MLRVAVAGAAPDVAAGCAYVARRTAADGGAPATAYDARLLPIGAAHLGILIDPGGTAGDAELYDVILLDAGEATLDRLWQARLAPYAANLAHGVPAPRPPTITLADPDPEWPLAAARLRRRLATALVGGGFASEVAGVDHIGSTSVPGLPAKPVLDLQLRVSDLDAAATPEFAEALAGAGMVLRWTYDTDDTYPWAPDPAEWTKHFAASADPAVAAQVHVRREGSAAAAAALVFRDWLAAHPSQRDAYAALKRTAAAAHPATAQIDAAYAPAKAPWIAAALQRARDWDAAGRP